MMNGLVTLSPLIALILCSTPLAAQPDIVAFGDLQEQRTPRFLYAANTKTKPVPINPSTAPILRERISVNFESLTLKEALDIITRESGLRLFFSKDVVPAGKQVRLQAKEITVAAALTEVLLDTNLDVLLGPDHKAALVRRTAIPLPERPRAAAVAGHVTEEQTRRPVVGAQVIVEGTGRTALTNSLGQYRIHGVPVGQHTVTVSSIGYKPVSRNVNVDSAGIVVDFALEISPSALSEIVVTATGQQRRVELGHVVGRLNADSLVKAAPVFTVSELLTGRVPGLQVNTFQGTVGGDVSVQVRSPNSIHLSNDPIVIVDGVRYTNLAAPRVAIGNVNNSERTSPLNDLNPSEIESIEIVKGPSASTLYGTDAANGVIVITTKRGRPGPPRWSAYIKGATTDLPDVEFADAYWGWGKTSTGVDYADNCNLTAVAMGACTQDSVSVIRHPFGDSETSIFATKPRFEYGASLSGGSEQLSYFFAADLESATGPLQMPPQMFDSISAERAIPEEQAEPNKLSRLNVRTNLGVKIGSTADLQVSAGYSNRASRTIGAGIISPYAAYFLAPLPDGPYGSRGPDQSFSRTSTERVSRFYGSVVSRWGLAPWLSTRMTLGVDVANITRTSVAARGEAPGYFNLGEIGDDRGRQLATTAELAATAAWSFGRTSFRTTTGVQYVRMLNDMLGSVGIDIPPGASAISAAARVETSQAYREQVTLGTYIEEQIGLNQRLFLTGALRADGASTFGRNYSAAVYPKAGVSWLLSEEPLFPRLPIMKEFRIRYAYGASGQQPRPEWARPGYSIDQRFINGADNNVYTVTALGNPDLRPERVREHEFGFDTSIEGDRLDLSVTWFRRKTVDQIVTLNLPPGLGVIQSNVGLTTGRGFEAQLHARPIASPDVSWDITLIHGFHQTVLRDLGNAAELRSISGGWVEGYPLGARFLNAIYSGFDDANGDGIINPFTELQFDTAQVYAGESIPPRTQSLVSTLGIFRQRVRLSAMFERRSGFTQLNYLHGSLQCQSRVCRAAVDPGTPLDEQARVAATTYGGYGFIERGDFTRLRELSVAVDVPRYIAEKLGVEAATIGLQGRNLFLWTSYSGADPESATLGAVVQELGIPQARTWALRLDVNI